MQQGFLPDSSRNYTSLTASELDQMPSEGIDSWLQPVWESRLNELVVRGTSTPFVPGADGGPHSRYAALFDPRPEFNALRVSFLLQVAGDRCSYL